MLLGLSGASLLFGAFNDWQYYLMGALFLLVGVVYMLRWQPASVSMNWRRRGRWLFPLVMLGTGGGAYALITFVAVPFLVPLASGSGEGIHHDDQALVVEADISLRQADLRIEGMT